MWQLSASRGPASPECSMPQSRSEAERFGEACRDREPSQSTQQPQEELVGTAVGCQLGMFMIRTHFHCYLIF